MTRNEEILKAARKYVSGVTLSSPSDVIHFEAGAKWSDKHPKNVWHDASEFPNKALPIIVEIDDDIEHSYEVISIDETDEKFWEYLVSDRDITIWAYIDDLLPKQL